MHGPQPIADNLRREFGAFVLERYPFAATSAREALAEVTGVTPVIYIGRYARQGEVDSRVTVYSMWVAHWTYDPVNTQPNIGIWPSYAFWQYADNGTVPGISTACDLDVYNGTSAVQIRRRIGMVFQKPNPFPTYSIYDNVAAGLKLNGFRDRRKLDEIVQRSLQQSALWDEVKDQMHKKSGASLSGGQQQRLCIARALAVEPQVILMDEPCSALDPISTGKIEELIFQLKEHFTIVIVTHNMQQASRVAEFTGFFLLGKLIEFDKTEKIFTNPSDKRTEDYITGRFG